MQITELGETSIVLSVSYDKTADCVAVIHELYRSVRAFPGISSIRCGFDALVMEWSEPFDAREGMEHLQKLQIPLPEKVRRVSGQVVQVPVCYEGAFGRDLDKVCETLALGRNEIVELHCAYLYDVWMIGFMPGFPYMGEIPERLRLERKRSPDPWIPAGSVAIAEEFVGIYPFDSPGGWHVIGRTPWKMMDYSRPKPWLFEYGMRVQFVPISSLEFERLKT